MVMGSREKKNLPTSPGKCQRAVGFEHPAVQSSSRAKNDEKWVKKSSGKYI
jgi:hypothetical protein